jgi:acetyl esterase/lipase
MDPISFSDIVEASATSPLPDLRIPYGPAPSQFVELRVAQGAPQGNPVVLVHGGCWQDAYGIDHVAPMAEALRKAGMTVFALEYRRLGEPGAGNPGTFDDVRAGIQTVVQQLRHMTPVGAASLPLTVVGHSAGGQLALWVAGEPGVRVGRVVSLAGITDLEAYQAPDGCGASVVPLLGGLPDEVPEAYTTYAPVARPPLPPTTDVVLVVAESDTIVPASQAVRYLIHAPLAHRVDVPGGHFDLVAPWAPSWEGVLSAIRGWGSLEHPRL